MNPISAPTSPVTTPLISVVILNYNGKRWLDRCLSSLKEQTIFDQIEVIIADNQSTDGSDKLSEELLAGWSNGKFLQNGFNYGFCEGNNRGAKLATGKYLFFLNNDTWLEKDCLEVLIRETRKWGAAAATPMMLNYEDDSIQSSGGQGFDVFGLMSLAPPLYQTQEIFVVGGCSYLIERELFHALGEFDPVLFMYADEYDLSWRVWLTGHRAIVVTEAHLHHRGAANVNPSGGEKVLEVRTSDSKRYYTNRNCLLVLLKSCQHLLLLTIPLQLFLLLAESVAWWAMTKSWKSVKRVYWDAVRDLWGMRAHIRAERQRLKKLRKRSDWQMLRFFKLRLNRWDEFVRFKQYGLPKVTR